MSLPNAQPLLFANAKFLPAGVDNLEFAGRTLLVRTAITCMALLQSVQPFIPPVSKDYANHVRTLNFHPFLPLWFMVGETRFIVTETPDEYTP